MILRLFLPLMLAFTGIHAAIAAESVEQLAAKVIEVQKVPAIGWFVVGSHASGNMQPHSDIDVLAIVSQIDRSYRQTGKLGAQAYQVSVYSRALLDKMFEAERRSGYSVVLNQIAHGHVVKDDSMRTLATIQAQAQALYNQGPFPVQPQALMVMCYRNKSWLEDFSDPRPEGEADALALSLYTGLVDYYLRSHNLWSTVGSKWAYRLLVEADKPLAERLGAAYRAYFKNGDKQPLLMVANGIMAKASCDLDNYRYVDPPVMAGPPAIH